MALEAVDVFLRDAATNAPVVGVVVRVYNLAGSQLLAQATSDADGLAGFLLDEGDYRLRFFKVGLGAQQPGAIQVISDPGTPGTTPNIFDVELSYPLAAAPLNPRLCALSGYFVDATGLPIPRLRITFEPRFTPILIDEYLMSDNQPVCTTDERGYASITLVRGAMYDAVIEGVENHCRVIRVPDQSTASLPLVLTPMVGAVDLGVAAVSLAVGGTVTLTPTVTDLAGVPMETLADVTFRSTNTSVLSVSATNTEVTLLGIGAGSAAVDVLRRRTEVDRIPNTGLPSLPVTVV